MLQFLIILAFLIALIAVLLGWRRDRRLLFKSRGERRVRTLDGHVLEKANEDPRASLPWTDHDPHAEARGCSRSACFTLTGSKNAFCHDGD
jgi:hypothetical protein